MWFRFVFLIFLCFAFVHCENEENTTRRPFGENRNDNFGSSRSGSNDDSQFSNSRGVINNKGSERIKQQTSSIREGERVTGSVPENSFDRQAGESHGRENNYDRFQGASSHQNNNRLTGTGGQGFGSSPLAESTQFSNNKDSGRHPSVQNSFGRPYGESESGQQFQSRPNNQGFSSGRPGQEPTNQSQQTGFRPIQNENNFSGRPTEGSFGSSSGFESSNVGRPSGSSTFGQSSGFRPGNEGHSSGRPTEGAGFGNSPGRPNEGSGFGHSPGRPNEGSGFGNSPGRPTDGAGFGNSPGRPNESSGFGNSPGRPNEGSGFGNSPGRPTDGAGFGNSPGRPNESSGFGNSPGRPTGSSGFGNSPGRPNEGSGFGQSSGLSHGSQTGSGTQRPTSNKEVEHSNSGKPEGVQNQGTEDGKEDDKDVCFTHLGCFKMGKPWKSTLRPVGAPHAPEKIQTVIHFYSRQNPKKPENITVYPQVSMGRAQFDPQKISAMIVHGFSNSGNATWMKEMKDVYLRKVDANVMIVDWGKGAQLLNYLQVAGNTRVVGKQLGMFVKYLIEQYGADPGRFHLIGHSLGAQICSYLAKDVPGIARLTALDPAQPGFEGFSKEVRLDQTDADFVDVIHTDARPFIPTLGFGMMAPHGHVDFYMNGGFDQPGCVPPPKKDLPVIKSFLDFAKFPVETIAKTVACPHARAYEYLIEAFNETDNCIFWGHKTDVKNVFKTVTNTVTQGLFKKFTALSTTCSKDDCIPLGFATKKSPLRGAFVVTTGARSPYCISEPGVPPETLPQDRKKKSMFEKIRETPVLG